MSALYVCLRYSLYDKLCIDLYLPEMSLVLYSVPPTEEGITHSSIRGLLLLWGCYCYGGVECYCL